MFRCADGSCRSIRGSGSAHVPLRLQPGGEPRSSNQRGRINSFVSSAPVSSDYFLLIRPWFKHILLQIFRFASFAVKYICFIYSSELRNYICQIRFSAGWTLDLNFLIFGEFYVFDSDSGDASLFCHPHLLHVAIFS